MKFISRLVIAKVFWEWHKRLIACLLCNSSGYFRKLVPLLLATILSLTTFTVVAGDHTPNNHTTEAERFSYNLTLGRSSDETQKIYRPKVNEIVIQVRRSL